jgi:hypothetical protein
MLTKLDYQNLAALLSAAKFDNVTLQIAAVHVALFDKVSKLSQAPETNGDSNSTGTDKPSTDQPSEQQ